MSRTTPEIRVSAFVAWIERIERRRHSRLAVERMDDHMLADIGLTRDQLRHEVRDSARPSRLVTPSLARGAL